MFDLSMTQWFSTPKFVSCWKIHMEISGSIQVQKVSSKYVCNNIKAFKDEALICFFDRDWKYFSLDSQLCKQNLTLEGLTLTFASPDTKNEWNLEKYEKIVIRRGFSIEFKNIYWTFNQMENIPYLNVRKIHEILWDVNNKLVHKSRSNVVPIHCVVKSIAS